MITFLAAAHYGGRYRGGGYGGWLIFHWLWLRVGWWSVLIYGGGAALIGGVKRMLGIRDQDEEDT